MELLEAQSCEPSKPLIILLFFNSHVLLLVLYITATDCYLEDLSHMGNFGSLVVTEPAAVVF